MASIHLDRKRRHWRVTYAVHLPSGTRRRSRYCSTRREADQMRRALEAVESATRAGMATMDQIEEWIGREWIGRQEARETFRSYRESGLSVQTAVGLEALLVAYEDYALDHSKAGSPWRKSHRNHMIMARQVVDWLKEEHPALDLTPETVEAWLQRLSRQYSAWSVHHYLTKLRLLLDQAVRLGMRADNPARGVSLTQPKRKTARRVLSTEEAQQLLASSLKPEYSHLISGCLATVVRLGLYAGLRNEEMAQCQWDWLDSKRRILTVKETRSPSGEMWVPKDSEARVLDVKEELVDHFSRERERQEREGLLGPYVVVAGNSYNKQHYRGRPIGDGAIHQAFATLVSGEGMDPKITPYSMRHTYCTSLLRAGVDIATVKARMGHSDLRTTMSYLHELGPETHPTDALPY